MKLTGKKALITGGNSGIGLATARIFVAEGAEIAITGRDQKTLDDAVAELGPNARGYRADVTVADDRKRLFADLAEILGKIREEPLAVVRHGNVGAVAARVGSQFGDCIIQRLLVSAGNRYFGAFCNENSGGGQADAAVSAGDE